VAVGVWHGLWWPLKLSPLSRSLALGLVRDEEERCQSMRHVDSGVCLAKSGEVLRLDPQPVGFLRDESE
jgi:hypothetical protein